MQKLRLSGFTLTVVLAAQTVAADEFQWHLERDADGIQVYTRDVDGSEIKAVKSTMTVTSSLAELVALVRDSSACAEWADLCAEAQVIDTLSETEMYVYTKNDIPWPVADRDVVAHVVWKQNAENLSVTMMATVESDKLPPNRDIVRLTEGVSSWEFTPKGEGQIEVTSQAHIDPGGAVPNWLTNRLLVGSPFTTMVGMRKLVQSSRYEGSTFDFLVEP